MVSVETNGHTRCRSHKHKQYVFINLPLTDQMKIMRMYAVRESDCD